MEAKSKGLRSACACPLGLRLTLENGESVKMMNVTHPNQYGVDSTGVRCTGMEQCSVKSVVILPSDVTPVPLAEPSRTKCPLVLAGMDADLSEAADTWCEAVTSSRVVSTGISSAAINPSSCVCGLSNGLRGSCGSNTCGAHVHRRCAGGVSEPAQASPAWCKNNCSSWSTTRLHSGCGCIVDSSRCRSCENIDSCSCGLRQCKMVELSHTLSHNKDFTNAVAAASLSHLHKDTHKLRNAASSTSISMLLSTLTVRPFRSHLVTFLLTILVALNASPAAAQPPSWEAKPVDTSVVENGRAVLTCQIRHLGSSKIAWLRENTNFFVDRDRWVAPPRFNVSRVTGDGGIIGGYDLVLNGATREDDADYTCQLQSQTLIATAHLTVLVKPRIPSITKSHSELTESDNVTFTCVTSEGNPAPTLRWFRQTDQSDQWEELTGAVATPPATKFDQSKSVLVRTMSRSDHKAHFKCTASNSAVSNNAPPEHIITLDVKYGPIVRITPSDVTGSHLVVVEGRNASLTCNVDSNPYTSSRKWEKDGVQISGANYRAVAKEDSGNYTCVATNVIRSTRTWLVMDVQYGPKVTVTSRGLTNDNKLYLSEGARANLSCDVTANPQVTTIQWKDAYNAVLGWERNYIMTNVKRTHAGSYSCFAESVLRPTLQPEVPVSGMQTVQVIIQYPPGKANITGPRYVLVGQDTVLHCQVPDKGVPEATLEWTRLGDPLNQVISQDNELRFTPAELVNNADYICKPTNTINDGEPDTFRLVVNEQPTWMVGGELVGSMTVNVTTPGALMVQCQARGRPLPRVRWYQDDTPVNDLDGLFTVETEHVAIDSYSFLVTSTLYWRGRGRDRVDRLRRTDTGRYQCQFSNEHGEIHSDMVLTVQYMPVLNVTADKVATDMNQSAILSCSSHAVPMPHFSWYNRSTLLTNSGRVSMTTEVVPGDFPYKATLNISDVTADDLGEYKCVGVNDLGFAEKYIFLTVKTTPDAPKSLQVVSRTWESVELTWTEGFDGGYRPTYYVFYTSARHNNTRVKVIPTTNKCNVTGLYPSLTYTFKVFGENQLGGGSYSANISTVTNAHPIEPPTEVFYHLVKRTLTFRSPSTNYCVRIEVHNGAQWRDYAECAPPSGSVKIRDGVPVSDVRIALCLQRRKEICSDTTKAFPVKPPPDDLSVETIVIVACVCGTVVLVLLCILIFLCIRRYQARKKDYENDLNAQRAGQAAAGGSNKKMAGIDNPSLDQTDVVDLDDRSRGRTFANDTSQQPRPNNANYVMFDQRRAQKAQNGQTSSNYGPNMNGPNMNGPNMNGPSMNGAPGNWNRPTGNISPNDPPPDYREVAKEGTPESEYIAMHKARKRPTSDVPDGHDSGYIPDHMREAGGDSGLSTPDPVKPKKWQPLHPSGLWHITNPAPPYGEITGMVGSSPYHFLPAPPVTSHLYSSPAPSAYHRMLPPWSSGGANVCGANGVDAQPWFSATSSVSGVATSSPQPYPLVTSSTSVHLPVLRVADDSPYGFHGAVPSRSLPRIKSNKAAPTRTQSDAASLSTGNILRRSATVSSRSLNRPKMDFIRGTLQSSTSLSSDKCPEDESKGRAFHYGFTESKRPIPAPSYEMFKQLLNMPQDDLNYSYNESSSNKALHDTHQYTAKEYATYKSHNTHHTQINHPLYKTHQYDGHIRQNTNGQNGYTTGQFVSNTEQARNTSGSDQSYEMSMQVLQPGLEVQLEFIHQRTSSKELQQSVMKDDVAVGSEQSSNHSGDLSSKKTTNRNQNLNYDAIPKVPMMSTRDEIVARKYHLKPVARKTNQAKKSHTLATNPQDAMAQLLQEQRQRDTDVSDVEGEETLHNIKPSAVKKSITKRRDKKNIPKVGRRPRDLTEAMNKRAPSGMLHNKAFSPEGVSTLKRLKKLPGILKVPPPVMKKPNGNNLPPKPLQALFDSREISVSIGHLDEIPPKHQPIPIGQYVTPEGSITGSDSQSKELVRPCSVCHQSMTVNIESDGIDAITDFTSSVVGSTLYMTRHVVCPQCQIYYQTGTDEHLYNARPVPRVEVVNDVDIIPPPPAPPQIHGAQVDWGSRTMTLPLPDPPYESDTDSTLHEYPAVTAGKQKPQKYRGTKRQASYTNMAPSQTAVNPVNGLYGVTRLPRTNITQDAYHPSKDITRHFVPPPPKIPVPTTPNDIYKIKKSVAENTNSGFIMTQKLSTYPHHHALIHRLHPQ